MKQILVIPTLVVAVAFGSHAEQRPSELDALLRTAVDQRRVPHVVAMVVEITPRSRDKHEGGAGFNQPAGNAEILDHLRGTVPLKCLAALSITRHDAGVFLRQIERLGKLRIGQDTHRLLRVDIHAVHCSLGIGIPPERVEGGPQPGTVLQSLQRNPVQDHVLGSAAGLAAEQIER